MRIHTIGLRLAAMAAIVLLGGILAATLARLAPGFDTDERLLDPRLSPETLQALRQARSQDSNILHFYGRYLKRALHGDLGRSQTLDRPVAELIAQRLPVTLRLVGAGLLVGWLLALALALTATLVRVASYDLFATALGGALLCLPSAVLALLFVWIGAPASLAIALVIFPKVFRYARNLLAASYAMPHVLAARARGIGNPRLLLWHVLPAAGSQLLALAGVSVSIALGAAIPVEALCSIPGLGQLAWQAALGRDLPLLVALTVLVTLATLIANSGAELANQALAGHHA